MTRAPTIRGGGRTYQPITITLSPEVLGRLDEVRAERGQTRSGCIAQLIRNARLGDK
jgi:metal-responsive CopG/Arc/MetJ family transcriptional regulator